MTNELVSIALCTYNGDRYLHEQLDSLIHQSYKNIEIIISDDGSTDQTISIIEEYIKEDDRIFLYRNSENVGFNLNFEQALKNCRGKFIAISDQDDIWCLDKIETVLNAWEDGVVLLHHSAKTFSGTVLPSPEITDEPIGYYGENIETLFRGNTVQGCTIVIKREVLDIAFPFKIDVYYDWWLATCAASIGKIQFIHKNLIFHRRHDNSAHYSKINVFSYKEQLEERCVYLHNVLNFIELPSNIKEDTNKYVVALDSLVARSSFVGIWWVLFLNGKIFFPKKSKKLFPYFSYLVHSFKETKFVRRKFSHGNE